MCVDEDEPAPATLVPVRPSSRPVNAPAYGYRRPRFGFVGLVLVPRSTNPDAGVGSSLKTLLLHNTVHIATSKMLNALSAKRPSGTVRVPARSVPIAIIFKINFPVKNKIVYFVLFFIFVYFIDELDIVLIVSVLVLDLYIVPKNSRYIFNGL